MSLKSEILALDSSNAITRLKSTLSALDDSAQKIAPLVGMLRHQIKKTGGDLQNVTKNFPPESLASSTLRNSKLYEDVFREHVLAGAIPEETFMTLSFTDCRALLEARKIATTAAKKGGASNLKIAEKESALLKSGKSAKDVLKSLKASARPIVAELNEKQDEREAERAKREAENKAERAKYDAWKASGAPASAPPPPPEKLDVKGAAEIIVDACYKVPANKRAKLAQSLRALADKLESEGAANAPDNVVTMSGEKIAA